MEAWVLIIAFAFYNADEKMESGSFTIDMPSQKVCEERASQFEEVKFSFGDRAFESSATCFNANKEEAEI
jgi:hypothetical protein